MVVLGRESKGGRRLLRFGSESEYIHVVKGGGKLSSHLRAFYSYKYRLIISFPTVSAWPCHSAARCVGDERREVV